MWSLYEKKNKKMCINKFWTGQLPYCLPDSAFSAFLNFPDIPTTSNSHEPPGSMLTQFSFRATEK